MKPPPSFPPLALPITPPYPPMEAERASTMPTGEGWLFEPKWDGFRALVFRDRERVVIQSKAGQPLERYFPELGLDGVMAKRVGEPYHSGDREGMVKIKHFHTADSVVGGFRYASGTRLIGSLLLGLYDEDGNLVFIGHASSFSQAKQKELKKIVEPLIAKNPFSVRVPGGPTRWATDKTGEWTPTRPKLVCEVEYDYFSQGRFRHGSRFVRWRPDKKPDQCTMDQVESKKKRGKVLNNLGME